MGSFFSKKQDDVVSITKTCEIDGLKNVESYDFNHFNGMLYSCSRKSDMFHIFNFSKILDYKQKINLLIVNMFSGQYR